MKWITNGLLLVVNSRKTFRTLYSGNFVLGDYDFGDRDFIAPMSEAHYKAVKSEMTFDIELIY